MPCRAMDATHLQGAPHGLQPAGEKGCGFLIGRLNGGMNTKLHAVTVTAGRPIRFFMTTGEVSDDTGARTLVSSVPAADWLLVDLGYDACWTVRPLPIKG